ncbi:MAG: hypothetical protein H6809_02465 [Phycisphaeraceae bacterium]|nr:hypothetical protein [Phycisphaeraceae bacterium]
MGPLQLNIAEAISAIRQCNASAEFRAAERLMHAQFHAPDSTDAESIAERVVLLDRLWATQMFWHRGLIDRVIDSLHIHAPRLLDTIRALPPDALEDSPDLILDAARVAMPIALARTSPQEPGGPYSFATKYLHWMTRLHFPIMDGRARLAINNLQRQSGHKPRIPTSSLDWFDDYPRWIAFYSDLTRSIAQSQREQLIEIDTESQPSPGRCRNSLLRVLDKVFYTLGSAPAAT